jgi:hypothetical protein
LRQQAQASPPNQAGGKPTNIFARGARKTEFCFCRGGRASGKNAGKLTAKNTVAAETPF